MRRLFLRRHGLVAYSFRQQFRAPILAGTKRQTIRADRKRHARPSEQLQLYTGMRTRQCAIIGRAVCESVSPARIDVEGGQIDAETIPWGTTRSPIKMDAFAREDGFADWPEMQAFWRVNHPGVPVFSGVLIRWGALL
jgi:hypothetical protein